MRKHLKQVLLYSVCVIVHVHVCACVQVHMGVCVNGLSFDIIWCQQPLIFPTHCQNAEGHNLFGTCNESLETAKVHLYNYAYLLLWLILKSNVGSMY